MTVPSPRPGDEASLAAHARFLRGLARGLLFDRSAADDVAQRALLVALEKQRRGEGKGDAAGGFSLRAWLAGVVRNLARQEGREARRRATREQATARPERIEAAVDSVARLELTQRVVAAVRALEEPYRTVVVLRWFDGLKPGAIAKRTGAPVETVRTRLKRALEQLRQKLDAQHGGERAQWGLLLLPTALPTAGGIAGGVAASVTFHALALGGVGAVAISTKGKVVIGTAAALFATLLLVKGSELVRPDRVPRRGDDASAAAPTAPDAAAPSAPSDAPVAERAELATPPPTDERELPCVLRATTVVEGRGPTAGLHVFAQLFDGYETIAPPLAEAELVSGEGGALVWPLAPPRKAATLVVNGRESEHLFREERHLLFVGEAPLRPELLFFPLDATVTGTVRDDRGEPLAGAQVQGFWSGPAITCDEHGAYSMRASSTWGQWWASAWAPGFAEATGAATLEGPGAIATLDFRLHAGFEVRGRVTDASGAAISGATVKAMRARFQRAVSDGDGRYALGGLDPHVPHWSLLAEHEGFAAATSELDAVGGVVTRDFVLPRGARVEGVVLAPDGAPIRGASLWIGDLRGLWGAPTTRSREDGSFVFARLAPGEQAIGGEADGLPAATVRFVVPPDVERVAGIELRFARERLLAGVVTDVEGEPLSGAMVAASRDGSSFDRHATTDGAGRFELGGLTDGALVVMASAHGYVADERRVAPSGRDELRFALRRAGALAGRVVDAESGEPLHRFRIRFVRPELREGEAWGSGYEASWSQPGRTFTTVDGTWRCDGEAIEPGSLFAIEATAEGYAPAIAPRVVCSLAPDPDEVVVRLGRGARVAGRIVGDDGRPVAAARVTLATASVPVLPYQDVERDSRWITRSDETGAFALDGAPPGACTLVVEHDDWLGAIDGPFEVPQRGAVPPRTIALERGGAIEGVLLDADGRPDAGHVVTLFPATNEGPFARMQSATTDGEGRFVFERLASATYQVSSQQKRELTTANELSARVAVVAPETATLRLEATGSARVVGRVESAGPLPASVELYLRWLGPPVAEGLLRDRGGYALADRFDFPRVEPGHYELTASCYVAATQQWLTASETIEVAEGKTAEVVVRLAAR